MIPNLPLRLGDAGEAVADLRRRLVGVGFDVGGDAPATFGAATEAAVLHFQEVRGLRIDGTCGEETWSSLVEAGHRLGDRLLSHRDPLLRGDDVAELQRLLGELGFDAGRVDGYFGPDTAAAVVEFQRNMALPSDGVCGPDTLSTLRRVVGRTGDSSTVAGVREVDAMRRRPLGLLGRRIAIGDAVAADALADALGHHLQADGALVTVLAHAGSSERADAANHFGADLYVGLAVRDEPGVAIAYYGREGFESVGGRRLADLLAVSLLETSLPDAFEGAAGATASTRSMRTPALRETRMAAVEIDLGPPVEVVRQLAAVVDGVVAAIGIWCSEPHL